MSLFQSPTAKRKTTPSNPVHAGTLHVASFTYVFNAAFARATDKIELGFMPADAKIKGATLIGEGLGVNNAKVGFMSGTPGDNDVTRTVGTDFFAAQDVNATEGSMTALAAKAIATSTADRGIGVELSTNDVTASSAKKITLVIEYYK